MSVPCREVQTQPPVTALGWGWARASLRERVPRGAASGELTRLAPGSRSPQRLRSPRPRTAPRPSPLRRDARGSRGGACGAGQGRAPASGAVRRRRHSGGGSGAAGAGGPAMVGLKEELLKSIWHAFTALDLDRSGKVSKSQLKASGAASPRGAVWGRVPLCV